MKKLDIKQLDEKDKEITDTLISLGMSRPIARTLSYLQRVNEATSVELEIETGLRKPEVSIAMKELKQCGWINEREEKKRCKGRPYKIYSFKIGFNDIIAQLEKQQRKATDTTQKKIERLKELGTQKNIDPTLGLSNPYRRKIIYLAPLQSPQNLSKIPQGNSKL